MHEESIQTAESAGTRMDGDGFMALLGRRRSTRMFKEQPVPQALLETLIRAACLMPTSCNRQLWHFVIITDPALKVKVSALSDAQQSYLYDAPALIAVFYDTSLETRNPCNTAEVTAGITIGTLLLAAEAHALGAIYLGGIRRPSGIGKAVGAPPYMRCFGLVCVGWRDDDPPSPNRREVADVLNMNRFALSQERYRADIRPHLWTLRQIADFRDKLLWYKGVHIDACTLHVDPDRRLSPLFQFMTGRLAMMLSRYQAPEMLDILSFNGDVVYQVLNACPGAFKRLYAYDLTPGIQRYMEERFARLSPTGPLAYLVNAEPDRLAIPLAAGQVQVISCYERLEHFEDPLPLLREMRRVLAPDGCALVLVSNRLYPHLYRYKRMRQGNYALGRNWNRGPERKFEPRQIERLFAEAGFQIRSVTGLQPVSIKIASVLASFCRRLGLYPLADRLADWAGQQGCTSSWLRNFSSVIAYELNRQR